MAAAIAATEDTAWVRSSTARRLNRCFAKSSYAAEAYDQPSSLTTAFITSAGWCIA